MTKRSKGFLAALAIIAAISTGLYVAAPAILATLAIRAASGTVDIQQLDIESVGLKQLDVAVIRINHNKTRIDVQDGVITYDLWPFRILSIDIDKVHVDVPSTSPDVEWEEAAAVVPVALPFEVRINELVVQAETPWGMVTLPAYVSVGPEDAGGYHVDIKSRDFTAYLRNPAPERYSLEILDAHESKLLSLNAQTREVFPVHFEGRFLPQSIIQWINTSTVAPARLKAYLAPYLVESGVLRIDGLLEQNLDFEVRLYGGASVGDHGAEAEQLFEFLEIQSEMGYMISRSDTTWSGSGDAAVTMMLNSETTLTARHPIWTWEGNAFTIDVTDPRLQELEASANTVKISAPVVDTNEPAGEISIIGATTDWWPETLESYDITGNWKWRDSSLKAEGTATGPALPELKWNLVTTDEQGNLEISSSQPVAPLTSSLRHYTNVLARELDVKSGDFDGRYRVEWDKDGLRTIINVTAGPMDLDLDEMEVRGLKIVLINHEYNVDSFDLKLSAPRLKLAAGAEAEDFNLEMLVAYPMINLDRAQTRLFDGEISLRPASFELDDDEIVLYADIDKFSLEKIMALFELESTQLTGAVAGPVRVLFSPGRGVEINQGDLHGIQPGALRFSMDQGSEMAAQFNNIAMQALQDFHYQELKASVIYKPNGDYRITARIVGNNPAVLEGHLIALNPTIEGNLPAVFRAFFLTGNFERAIIEQLQNKGGLSTPGETSSFKED